MSDPRIANLAKTLVHYSTKVEKGDRVAIAAQPVAAPLIREVYREILRAGGHPYVMMQGSPTYMPGVGDLSELLLREASDEQLEHVDVLNKLIVEQFDARIFIYCEENTRSLTNTDPARMMLRNKAHREVIQTYKDRSSTGDFKWAITLFPTQAFAQDAEMSLSEFEDYVYSTTYSDTPDPVAAWNRIHDEQQRLVDWMVGKKQIHASGPNIDLQLSVEGRRFLNADGTKNMPSGEIYTSPVEDSANGWVNFTYPVVFRGREVNDVRLRFVDGVVVEASAAKNEAFLLSMLDTDEGARRLGEFAIGTNKMINRFIKNILFDEKIGGTLHLAVGFGFPEAGSKNMSVIHWDMICDMRQGGRITVDDELIYENGDFIL